MSELLERGATEEESKDKESRTASVLSLTVLYI